MNNIHKMFSSYREHSQINNQTPFKTPYWSISTELDLKFPILDNWFTDLSEELNEMQIKYFKW